MKTIPKWVNWIATDKDGEVFGYENKPYRRKKSTVWSNESKGKFVSTGVYLIPDDWTKTLIKHEQKGKQK